MRYFASAASGALRVPFPRPEWDLESVERPTRTRQANFATENRLETIWLLNFTEGRSYR